MQEKITGKMKWPSLTLIFSGIFIAYVLHSMWSLFSLFIPPKCNKEPCFNSYFNSDPKLNLILYTSEFSKPTITGAKLILHLHEFDYNKNFEK